MFLAGIQSFAKSFQSGLLLSMSANPRLHEDELPFVVPSQFTRGQVF